MSNEPTDASTSKSEIVKAIGATMAERRKTRGLSVEKAAQSLKMRPLFIKAIEDGEWQHLPGEVYARGFIFRYAQLLGLNGGELLEPYLKLNVSQGNQMRPGSSTPPTAEWPKSVLVWAGVGLVVLVAVIKVVVSDHQAARQVTAAKEMEAKPSPSAPAKTPTKEGETSKAPPPHTIDVFSPFPLWLSVKAENRSFEGFIPQGATWSWKGEGKFAVRFGHTQQVVLSFDGHPVALEENQKRVTLPSEN